MNIDHKIITAFLSASVFFGCSKPLDFTDEETTVKSPKADMEKSEKVSLQSTKNCKNEICTNVLEGEKGKYTVQFQHELPIKVFLKSENNSKLNTFSAVDLKQDEEKKGTSFIEVVHGQKISLHVFTDGSKTPTVFSLDIPRDWIPEQETVIAKSVTLPTSKQIKIAFERTDQFGQLHSTIARHPDEDKENIDLKAYENERFSTILNREKTKTFHLFGDVSLEGYNRVYLPKILVTEGRTLSIKAEKIIFDNTSILSFEDEYLQSTPYDRTGMGYTYIRGQGSCISGCPPQPLLDDDSADSKDVTIKAKSLEGSLNLQLIGANGLRGWEHLRDRGRAQDGVECNFRFCSSELRSGPCNPGTPGKDGLDGFNGQDGWDGGNSGNLSIYAENTEKFKLKYKLSFGFGGPGGRGGPPQLGGLGPQRGRNLCPNDPNYQAGKNGKPGNSGNKGKDGKLGTVCLEFTDQKIKQCSGGNI